jgi:predicted nucleotide-binding protein
VTKPSDIDGVLYISMDSISWKMELFRELKAAGMDIDANKVF